MKRSTGFVIIALAVIVVMSFTTLAVAQNGDERRAAFESAPKKATSVGGVHAFMAPAKGFNPLTAANSELYKYGLPARPDKVADPKGYGVWQRGMLALKTHADNVKTTKITHTPMKEVGEAKADVSGVTYTGSYNWSAIAAENKLKSWSAKTSYDYIVSVWNVPNGQPPFGTTCGYGPVWLTSVWNGIDGANNNDVVQGGSTSGYECDYGLFYYGWIEWYPSYAELEIFCDYGNGYVPCYVAAGDDFWVETFGAPGTSTQTVYIEDITQQWWGTFGLSWVTGQGLVGKSAEWVVERPCCVDGYFYPLNNYIYDFFDYSFAYDGHGTTFYPGATAASNFNITMYADDEVTAISTPGGWGTAGYQGRYSIWFNDENCAYSGGCAY